jgi:cell division protein FtsB
MRQSKALTAVGTVRTNFFGVRQAVVLVVGAAIFVWAGVAFAQEAYVSHRLSQQVSDLRRQNADIAAQNAGYKKDVQGLTSGSANEEEARLNGYAKPNEKTYLVTTPPSPSPSPSPSPRPTPSPSPKAH